MNKLRPTIKLALFISVASLFFAACSDDKKSDAGVSVPAGGIEQELKMKPEEEMEQQLPPGISESGEVVDMAAYEAWQQENHPDIQQHMQRREEVNINVHRERGEDVEPGDDF